MPPQWEVVGGADKGGILVRKGQDLKSPQYDDRLSTGALVQELKLFGDRLHFRRLTGTGPVEGWVSTKISGKELLVKKGASGDSVLALSNLAEDVGGPAESSGTVDVDQTLKSAIEAECRKKQTDFLLYCMKYKLLGFPLEKPKLRILAFHNAGSAESIYTGPGTPFMSWIKDCMQVELLAFDYPGRDKLLKAKLHTSIDTLAPELLAVAHDKLSDGVPYVVWGHSVGSWVGFEFLMLARKIGLPMPKAAFFITFPAPHMPETKRPWRQNARLNEEQMREETVSWDKTHFAGPSKVIFDEPAWTEQWGPMMRADFKLFDEYKFKHAGAPRFDFPLHCWWAEGEHLIKQDMVELWREWTSSTFDFQTLKDTGHMTGCYNPVLKKAYFQKVTDLMQRYAGL
eukprot:TRINITY_DN27533_c0_g1_i1.p1 TRINITY_DN27533_c0_g1~~TRINITY_DN27533_c0_g1_i1.p1  ORF type:complete len:399 (-),score=81.31 TRINITY_DN27533_c0_g1_i1:41-1237(-)